MISSLKIFSSYAQIIKKKWQLGNQLPLFYFAKFLPYKYPSSAGSWHQKSWYPSSEHPSGWHQYQAYSSPWLSPGRVQPAARHCHVGKPIA